MFATQVLPETPANDSEGGNSSDIIGLIIVRGKEYDLKRGETKIGRDPTMCSVVIENPTVSKVHAIVESEGIDDTFIYDVGSTNQTRLGKKVLKPHCRYKLDDKSIVTLGNITAKFVLPPDKSSDTNSEEARPVPFDEVNDLEDIFDIPTQVSVPRASSSSTKGFEALQENFGIFKIPNSGSLTFKSSKSCFDEDTRDRLHSQRTKQRTVFGSLEKSGIFSVETQHQLYEHPEGEKCSAQAVVSDENENKNSEPDEIKSLLDDGQDEVLCTFMSLHSPEEERRLLKEIKTEILTQDAPTEAEEIQESVEEKERRELSIILRDEDLTEDFPARSMSSITSTPLNNNIGHFKIPDRNDSHTAHSDEKDFLHTQESNANRSESSKRREAPRDDRDSLSKDAEIQPYVGGGSDEVEANGREHDDDDLILTQASQVSEKRPENKQSPRVIPETEETVEFKEDFMKTQTFPAENKPEAGGLGGKSGVGRSVNMTERSNEDDFIGTQIFEDVQKSDARWDRSAEDFIATQKVDSSGNGTSGDSGKDGVTVRGASRESSPDLLTAELYREVTEDCISTQIWEPVVHQNPVADVLVSEKDNRDVPRSENVESSGDETESDLEIILEKKETGRGFTKCEPMESNPRVLDMQENDESNPSYIFELGPGNQPERGNQEENKRPVAQQQSDSDETDCEEMEIANPTIPVKQEPKVVLNETQVMPRTLPDDYAEKAGNDWEMDAESPTFIAASPLSLEMPSTQDIEATMNRMLGNTDNKDFETPSKSEVGMTKESVTSSRGRPWENRVNTPLKRQRDNSGVGIVPVKKYKIENSSDRLLRSSERQFSKLVQAHDITQIKPSRTRNSLKNVTTEREIRLGNNINDGHIAQIRPSRTRNSLKNVTAESEVQSGNNVNNHRPTSRRRSNPKKGGGKNQNGDITSYLVRKVERRPSPKENRPVVGTDRVLRSSMKRATATVLTTSPERNRRSSRTKTEEYFSGPHVNIVFTGFDSEKLESIISGLGGRKTNDMCSGEVVVADKVRRTVKFLSAIGLSLPIVSPQWLLSSKREKKFLNPWNFILKDKESEKKWDFELKASLERAKKVKLFRGFSVFATKSAKPPVKDLLAIVEFCGGTPLFDSPDVWPKKTIIVSCPEDKKWWPLTKYRNVKIVHYEFILSGVLRQEIDFKTYKLR